MALLKDHFRSPRMLVAAVLVLQVGIMAYLLWRSSANRRIDVSVNNEDLHNRKPANDGGVPIQRSRIDGFIERTAAYDLEEATAALSDSQEDYNFVFMAGMSSTGEASQFPRIMADRRVARIYQALAAMPWEERVARSKENFEKGLQRHLTHLQLKQVDAGETLEQIVFATPRDAYALSASLLLCAQFCDGPTVLEYVDRWTTQASPVVEGARKVIEGHRDMIDFRVSEGLPDTLFLANLYLVLLDRFACVDDQELTHVLGRRLPLTSAHWFAWDAHTTTSDFTHKHRGVPVDEEKIIKTFKVVREWQGPATARHDGQQAVVASLRGLVEKCIEKQTGSGGPGSR